MKVRELMLDLIGRWTAKHGEFDGRETMIACCDRLLLQDELLALYREASIIPRGLKESEHAAWVMRYKILTDKITALETKLKEG